MVLLLEEEVGAIARNAYPGEEIQLLEYSVEGLGKEKRGFLGDHFILVIRVTVAGRQTENSFFIKTYHVSPEKMDFLGETGLFAKETKLYKEVFGKLWKCSGGPKWCPGYYFSKPQVLVLEDLSRKKFEINSGGYFLDEAHLKLVLSAVAVLHASTMVLEKKANNFLDRMFADCFREILYDESKTDSPPRLWKERQVLDLVAAIDMLDKYSASQKESIKKLLPAAIDNIYWLSKKSERWPNVLVHGDLWINNIMFRYEEGKPVECRLVDFQFSRYAPPMHDVMHLLHLTTDREFREKMEKDLLLHYHRSLDESLSSRGLDVNLYYPWNVFLESRENYNFLAIIQSLLSLHYLLGGRRVQEDPQFGTWDKNKVDEHLTKTRDEFIKTFFADEAYKTRVSNILYELIDKYILQYQK